MLNANTTVDELKDIARRQLCTLSSMPKIYRALSNGRMPEYNISCGIFYTFSLEEVMGIPATIDDYIKYIDAHFEPNFAKAYEFFDAMNHDLKKDDTHFWYMVRKWARHITETKEEPIADFNDFTE